MACAFSLECDADKNYVKVVKQSKTYPGEERYTLFSGETDYITTEALVRNELQTFEYCINKTVNNQYQLKLTDTIGDGWDSGSWIEFIGPYENTFYKGYIPAGREMIVNFSMYTPVEKASTWKFSNTAEGNWYAANYDDSQWIPYTHGVSTPTTSGTQYFRKTFTGISDLAAYEVRFNYRAGIVAYLNGVEIYRKNMAPGAVTSDTYATGQFNTAMFRGVVRSAAEVSGSTVTLAVELHAVEGEPMTSVDFDAWVSVYAQSVAAQNCYAFPYETTMSSADGSSPANAHDWAYISSYMISPWAGEEGRLTFGMTSTVIPAANAIMWYPSTRDDGGALSYRVGGSNTLEAVTDYTTISYMYNQAYAQKMWTIAPMYFSATAYQYYRMYFLDAGEKIEVPEVYLGVCGFSVPTALTLSDYSLDGATNVDSLETVATTLGAFNCSLVGTLPAGLIFNANACSVSGVATEPMEQTSFTMVCHGLQDIEAVFTVTITTCNSPVMEIERVYGESNPTKETFKVIDLTTNEAIVNVQPGTSQVAEGTMKVRICAIHPRYEVDLSENEAYWERNSYVNVYTVVGTDQREPVLKARFDNQYLNLPTSYYVSMQRPVEHKTNWYYLMGSLPANWYDSSVTGFTEGQYGQYPASTNHIQVYKKTFSVASLANGGAFSLGIAYRFGCVVYMNGHEVFRNHLPAGAITASTTAEGAYESLMYRFVSLPYRTIAAEDAPSVEYLKEGSNTIAIALIGLNPAASSASTFDAVLRTMGDDSISRVMDAEFVNGGFSPRFPDEAFNGYYSDSVYESSGADMFMEVKFKDDRREWISSAAIQSDYYTFNYFVKGFRLRARNSAEEEWTTLLEADDLKWWVLAQKKNFYIPNNKAYNIYRFDNFTRLNSAVSWRVNNLYLAADRISTSIPDLSYQGTLEGYKDIELAEVYPSSDKYMQFSVAPALPTGMSIDPSSGIIMGTPRELQSGQVVISARKLSGETTSFSMSVNIVDCDGDRHLITVTVRTDGYPKEMEYKLLQGRGLEGEVIKHKSNLQQRQTLVYEDNCLVNGLYTFVGMDVKGDGWSDPAGYMMSIDQGELRFDMNLVPVMAPPSLAQNTFSSYLPFQINFSQWKTTTSRSQATEGWNNIGFDDSQWEQKPAAEIGETTEKVLYVRKVFNIPNLDDFQVLNVRVKYLDGLVVYFNGKRVARFNMPDTYEYDTPALQAHDPEVFSKFGFVLSLSGAVVGDNVIAFEMHRAEDVSTAVPFVFDASGVFGVETCSPLVYSVVNVNSTKPYQGLPQNLFDLYTVTFMRFTREIGSFVSWELETMDNAVFNGFGIFNNVKVRDVFSSLYGYTVNQDEVEVALINDPEFKKVTRYEFATSVGLMGFHSFRYELNAIPRDVPNYAAFSLLYCKASGSMCPGIDQYPSVSEGQISPALCDYGFTGYAYRNCTDGQLGEVGLEHCTYLFPEELAYESVIFPFVRDTQVSTGVPTFKNIITEFYIAGDVALPQGLALNTVTGEISGMPKNITEGSLVYTIVGKNPVGAASTTISISVRIGSCMADGVFPKTDIDTEVIYECKTGGSYIGTQKRLCTLGEKDGVWSKTTGFCMSIVTLIVIIVVVVIIIVVVVLILVKVSKKKGAVRGVKGKATKATKTKTTV